MNTTQRSKYYFQFISSIFLFICITYNQMIFAKGATRWHEVISSTGYVEFMARATCIMNLKLDERAKQQRFTRLEQEFGLNLLSQQEQSNMVANFKKDPDVGIYIVNRIAELTDDCQSGITNALKQRMSRSEYIAYMAESVCLSKKYKSKSVVDINRNLDRKYNISGITNRERNELMAEYDSQAKTTVEIIQRVRRLNGQCQLPKSHIHSLRR